MAAQNVTVSTNADAIAAGAWRSNDSLNITNGAIVTVNTNQDKFWSGINITNGKLRIENTSTSNAIRFLTGRVSGAAAQAITPGSGVGVIEVAGNWIEVGTGDGTSGQELSIPYTDYVAALWVETAAASGVYEIWTNSISAYLPSIVGTHNGLAGYGYGVAGKVFEQLANPVQDVIYSLTNSTIVSGSRTIIVSSTAGLTPGAHVTGSSGVPANSVVEKIVDSTTLEINANCTLSIATVTLTIYNTYTAQLLGTAKFGDNVHGNKIPTGAKVRIPNILITGVFGQNIGTANAGTNFTMTNGGICTIDTCLFDNANHSFGQAQTLSIKNSGWAYGSDISKVYGLEVDGLAISPMPQRRYVSAGRFIYGATYSLNCLAWSYLTGNINNLVIQPHTPQSGTSSNDGNGFLKITYADGMQLSNIRVVVLGNGYNSQAAFAGSYINSCTITNITAVGCSPFRAYASSDNTVDGILYQSHVLNKWAQPVIRISNNYNVFTTDPNTGEDFIEGTTYYFKTVLDSTVNMSASQYVSREYAMVPHRSPAGQYSAITTTLASNSVTITWTQNAPTHSSPSYELFRDVVSTVPTRDVTTRKFTTNTAATVTYNDTTVVNDTTYWYVLRKHISAGVYIDSPPIEATPTNPVPLKNYILAGNAHNHASWTNVSITAVSTNADTFGIHHYPNYNSLQSRRVNPTAINATHTAKVAALSIGLPYTASVWAHLEKTTTGVASTDMRLTFGTVFVDFSVTETPARQSVTFVATATSHTFELKFATANIAVVLGNCQVNDGATPLLDLLSTATALTTNVFNPSFIQAFTRLEGATKPPGIALYLPTNFAAGIGSTYRIHCSTEKGFTPSDANCCLFHTPSQNWIAQFSLGSSRNVIKNLTQLGAGWNSTGGISLITSSSDNKLSNFDINLGGGAVISTSPLIVVNNDANRNSFVNFDIRNMFPFSSTMPTLTMDNTANGTSFTNMRFDHGDIGILPYNNEVTLKGISGGFARVPDGATTWAMGGTTDGVPITFTAMYDTHFAELYHTDTLGALNIFFQASTATVKPYVLTGTAGFSNTGALYLQTPGDSIEYTWPHKIYGVSGFRNMAHKCWTAELGTSTDVLEALLLEFQVNTGTGYSAWAEATPAALSALTLSASDGFNLKLKITARQFLKYANQTAQFVVGEVIRQQTSNATARIVEDFDLGTTGTLVVDSVTGVWSDIASYDIYRDSDSAPRCPGIALVNGYAMGPSYTSLIRGLQIHTTVDRTVLYPTDANTITFTGIPSGADMVVLTAGTTTILYSLDQASAYSYTYSGAQNVDVGFIKQGYVPYYIRNLALTTVDSSIPVAMTADRNFV